MEYYLKQDKLFVNFKFGVIKFGDIENIEVRKGIFSLSPTNYKTQGIPFLRVADLKGGTIIRDSLIFISNELNNREKNTQLLPGDLVFSKVGTIDEVSMLPDDFNLYNMSQNIIGVKIRKNNLFTSDFIRHFFQLNIGKNQLLANAMSGVQPKLTLGSIRDIKLPLIPLEIQNQIVEKMDKALEIKKQKEKEAKDLLESIDDFVLGELGIDYKVVEEKKIFGINLSELGESKRFDSFYNNPKFIELEKILKKGKYEVKKINENLFLNKKLENIKEYNFINYIDLSCVNDKAGNIENIKILDNGNIPSRARQKVKKGDLLISTLSGSMKSIGIIKNELENLICSTGFIVIKKSDKYSNYFLFGLFRTDIYQNILISNTTGGIMSAISTKSFENLEIPLPPLEIQNKIAKEVKSRIEKAEKLKDEAKEVYENGKREIEDMILGE